MGTQLGGTNCYPEKVPERLTWLEIAGRGALASFVVGCVLAVFGYIPN